MADSVSQTLPALPLELWISILSHLDNSPSTVQSQLRADPESFIDAEGNIKCPRQADRGLKSASMVCRSWRQILLPSLFSNVVMAMSSEMINRSIDCLDRLGPILNNQRIAPLVENLTIIMPRMWLDHPTRDINVQDANEMWKGIFACCNPRRVTLVGVPPDLGRMLGLYVNRIFEWVYGYNYTILHLEQSSSSTLTGLSSGTEVQLAPHQSILFSMRPWTSLLVNEGSFFSVYNRYEFFDYLPPSVLREVLLIYTDGLDTPTQKLQSFSYIAIFPVMAHVGTTVAVYPGAESFYLQIDPGPDFFDRVDSKARTGVDVQDPWVEYDDCLRAVHGAIVRAGLTRNMDRLREFKTSAAGGLLTKLSWVGEGQRERGITWEQRGEGHWVKIIRDVE